MVRVDALSHDAEEIRKLQWLRTRSLLVNTVRKLYVVVTARGPGARVNPVPRIHRTRVYTVQALLGRSHETGRDTDHYWWSSLLDTCGVR